MHSGRKPFRLGVQIPAQDGTSFYRGTGPLFRLQKELGDDIRIEMSNAITWAYFAGIDGLFMQRPFTADHVRIMKMAKANGCPVWLDYDDDLFSVPMQNPTFSTYSRKDVQNNIVHLLMQADMVSVSTPYLLKRLQDIVETVFKQKKGDEVPEEDRLKLDPDKFVLVPNAYDEKLFNLSFRTWKKPAPDPLKLLLWRGSATHDSDLSAFTTPMANAFQRAGHDWTFNFVGKPWWGTLQYLRDRGIESDRIQVTDALDVIEYMHYLSAVRPHVMQVPLLDDTFNRSKSNIAWIEACHAGAICLAPDWDEWKRPGIVNYKNGEDYYNKLFHILSGNIGREALLMESRNFIAENLTLSNINRRRAQIIERLARIDPWA